ncbi:MAG: bifunctional UDP-3-O-[3-hydroxymyristoyl] N-acetylglucosamine deacetylase/3-hydroxyacyl-ACP dehydratase [Chitinophagales bacterium]|nr:bifunctional UDP-3-O-[3-hydroxymyristoyl] N-acetylglucosamine deacetylase/3-hydroxyacyl-ACP dehydratase [Chitinophagales bacterium]
MNSTNQQTIKKAVSISGVGLHTGQHVTINFLPAAPNHGIKFQRIDLPEKPIVPADVDLVVSVDRGTTLDKNGVKVATVEHLMAACLGLQIDNLLIELNGMEIPIMDGSSAPFIEALESAGLQEQSELREVFELRNPISYIDKENGVEMLAMPSDHYRVTAMIDYQSPILGQQHASLDHLNDFKKEFASARTFCFLHELEMLLDAGLIKGGDLNNAIVVVDKQIEEKEVARLAAIFQKPDIKVVEEGILNNVKLRHANEPARHKLLDIMGDLALVGIPFNAQIIATRPGHKSNIEFGKKIKAYIKKARLLDDAPEYDVNEPPIYDSVQIKRMLPHRYPFALVDKIIKLNEKEVVGVKNVTFNEEFFQGHFPDNPVMPGVLQIEALAQTGGILVLREYPDPENYDTYFLKIDKAKFKQKVVPGDTLILKMELLSPVRRGIVEMKGTAFVGSKMVCEAELMARVVRRDTTGAKQAQTAKESKV